MKLERPTIQMQNAYLDFAREWDECGEEIIPYSARLLDMTYPQWLDYTYRIETEELDGFVTAHTYFLVDDGRITGAINIRHELRGILLTHGHIGYGIRPSERGRGYGSLMLRLALPKAKQLGIDKALVSCNKSNAASAATIRSCGGVLQDEVHDEVDGEIMQRYWITV